jgi:hypothetical protein
VQVHDDRAIFQATNRRAARDRHPQPLTGVGREASKPRGTADWDAVCQRRQKNATEAGAGRFEKPAPDARAAPPEAHKSLISRKTGAEVPLTGLSLSNGIRAASTACAEQDWLHPRFKRPEARASRS